MTTKKLSRINSKSRFKIREEQRSNFSENPFAVAIFRQGDDVNCSHHEIVSNSPLNSMDYVGTCKHCGRVKYYRMVLGTKRKPKGDSVDSWEQSFQERWERETTH